MGNVNETCTNVLKYVHANYSKKITLRDIARTLYTNPAYLGRIFAKQYGISFDDYLIAYRIRIALWLLKQHENMLVIDVSKAVGYPNTNYFYRVFKKHTGVTPTQYRLDARLMLSSEYQMALKISKDQNRAYGSSDGSIVHEIDLPVKYPDCMGSALLTKEGIVLYCYIERSEHNVFSFLCIESADDGVTWKNSRVLFQEKKYSYIFGLNMIDMLDGSLGLFYFCSDEKTHAMLFLRKSLDGGHTWTDAQCCLRLVYGYQALNGRMIRLHSGRLILPLSRPVINSDLSQHQQVICHYYSEDDGNSWVPAQNNISMMTCHSIAGMKYPMVLELGDSALLGLAATELGRQYEYSSNNEGVSWTSPLPSYFTSPLAAVHVVSLKDKKLLAVLNPVPDFFNGGITPRNRLVYCVSFNQGKSWSRAFLLDESQQAQPVAFRNPYIYVARESVLFVYQCIRKESSQIVLRRLDLSLLQEA